MSFIPDKHDAIFKSIVELQKHNRVSKDVPVDVIYDYVYDKLPTGYVYAGNTKQSRKFVRDFILDIVEDFENED